MKKIFFYISAAILVLCMAACSKETPATPETGRQMAIVANIEDALNTKASLDGNDTEGYQVLWSEGDQINIHGEIDGKQETFTYTLTKGAGTTSGVFEGPELPDGEYTAGYGDNLSMANGGILLNEQSYSPSMNAGCAPMMAEVTVANGDASITKFKNICGLMRLKLKGAGMVKEIKITTNQAQGGLIDLDEDGAARVRVYPGIKEITLNCGKNGVDLTPEGTYFYISMPKKNYTGVEIEVTDVNNDTCTRTLKADKTLDIARAQITPVGFEVTFYRGRGRATNKNGETVGWVQLWADGPKFAEYNVGVTDGKAESIGGYYCRGKSIDKDPNHAYNNQTSVLTGNDDTATNLWGDNWRMPTQAEFEALLANCDQAWTQVNDVNGYKFTGRDLYASNSLFLPATGAYQYNYIRDPGQGFYWSSSPYSGTSIYAQIKMEHSPAMVFGSSIQPRFDQLYRGWGLAVRAVLK